MTIKTQIAPSLNITSSGINILISSGMLLSVGQTFLTNLALKTKSTKSNQKGSNANVMPSEASYRNLLVSAVLLFLSCCCCVVVSVVAVWLFLLLFAVSVVAMFMLLLLLLLLLWCLFCCCVVVLFDTCAVLLFVRLQHYCNFVCCFAVSVVIVCVAVLLYSYYVVFLCCWGCGCKGLYKMAAQANARKT